MFLVCVISYILEITIFSDCICLAEKVHLGHSLTILETMCWPGQFQFNTVILDTISQTNYSAHKHY